MRGGEGRDGLDGRDLGPGESLGVKGGGVQSPAEARRAAHGAGEGRGAQTGGAVPPVVCMLKYSVNTVCGAAVWGTSGW